MRARRTDAPRKTAMTMAVMAPGPSTPAHTHTHRRRCSLNRLNTQDRNKFGGSERLITLTFLLVHGLGVRGVLVVEGEGLLRHVLERVFGGDVTGGLSGHGVLVVPGRRGRVCDRLCRPRKKKSLIIPDGAEGRLLRGNDLQHSFH